MHFVAEYCLISVLTPVKHKGNKLLVSTFNFMIIKQSNSVKKKVYETNQVVYTLSDREAVESI